MSIKQLDVATIRAFAIWAGAILGVLAFFAVAVASAEVVYTRLYQNQMFPGVRILNVRVDGLTKGEARQAVQKAIDEALAKGLRFRFRSQDVQLEVTTAATDPDASRDLVTYALDQAVDQAYDIGRSEGWLRNISEQLGVRVRPMSFQGTVSLDTANIEEALHQAFREKLAAPQNASISIQTVTGTAPMVGIRSEQGGYRFRTEEAFRTLQHQAETLSFEPIALQEEKVEPTIFRTQLELLLPKIEQLLRQPSVTFTYGTQDIPIPMNTLAGWITVADVNGSPEIAYDSDRFLVSIRNLAPTIEQQAKNGNLVIKDGKIESFQAGVDGVAIDVAHTLAPLKTEWPAKTVFPIVTIVSPASLTGEDTGRLGIKEIIGIGRSNFSGSPSNRRKNIRLGAEKVNGTLIGPGEEFSLLKVLGEIDGIHGWLPELVIKGNKTVPEYGGGLCQIGTTIFRAALNSGLKITERRNHSYRVRYYEPAGMDATIYDPSPDFRFVNDTGASILVNAYLKGDEAIFEVWGTKDGRRVEPIKPTITNITSPPPTKLVETTDLPPGQKKCTETAHPGADAQFTYTVTYADGTKHSEVFLSHYRAWQAVCLIGVEKIVTPTDAPIDTQAPTTQTVN